MVFLLFLSLLFIFKDRILRITSKIGIIWNQAKTNRIKLWSIIYLKIGFNFIGLGGRIGIAYLLGVEIPIWELVCIILTVNFFISMPISINGIGVREVGYVGFLSFVGVPENIAFSFALCEFSITISVALIGIIIFTFIKLHQFRIKLKK
jgi:hypothetical protein